MPESNFSLIITRNENVLTQRSVVEYLSCLLNENISGEAMARMVLKKVNGKRSFIIDKDEIYRILSKKCYATL